LPVTVPAPVTVPPWILRPVLGALKEPSILSVPAVWVKELPEALLNVLQQNVSQYESAFGEIKLEPHAGAAFVQ